MAPKKRKKSSITPTNKRRKANDRQKSVAKSRSQELVRDANDRPFTATSAEASAVETMSAVNHMLDIPNDLDVDQVIADNYQLIEEAMSNSGQSWPTNGLSTDVSFSDLCSRYLATDFKPSEDDFNDLKMDSWLSNLIAAEAATAEVVIEELKIDPIIAESFRSHSATDQSFNRESFSGQSFSSHSISGQSSSGQSFSGQSTVGNSKKSVMKAEELSPEDNTLKEADPTIPEVPSIAQIAHRSRSRAPVRAERLSDEQKVNLEVIRRAMTTMNLNFRESPISRGVLIGLFGLIRSVRSRLVGVMKVPGSGQYKRGERGGSTGPYLHSMVVIEGQITVHVDDEEIELLKEELVIIPRRRHYFLTNDTAKECLLFFNVSN